MHARLAVEVARLGLARSQARHGRASHFPPRSPKQPPAGGPEHRPTCIIYIYICLPLSPVPLSPVPALPLYSTGYAWRRRGGAGAEKAASYPCSQDSAGEGSIYLSWAQHCSLVRTAVPKQCLSSSVADSDTRRHDCARVCECMHTSMCVCVKLCLRSDRHS